MRALVLAVTLAVTLAAGCVPQRDYIITQEAAPMGIVRVDAPVKDALIYVDDFFAGTVGGAGRRGIPVEEGVRRIEIRHEHYHSNYQVIRVVKKQTTVVTATLREVLE